MEAAKPALDVYIDLVTQYLSPLHGYRREAVDRLAETLRNNTAGISHATATLEQFRENCPTPAEIEQQAHNLDPQAAPIPGRPKWRCGECGETVIGPQHDCPVPLGSRPAPPRPGATPQLPARLNALPARTREHDVAARRHTLQLSIEAGNPRPFLQALIHDYPELWPEFPELRDAVQ